MTLREALDLLPTATLLLLGANALVTTRRLNRLEDDASKLRERLLRLARLVAGDPTEKKRPDQEGSNG